MRAFLCLRRGHPGVFFASSNFPPFRRAKNPLSLFFAPVGLYPHASQLLAMFAHPYARTAKSRLRVAAHLTLPQGANVALAGLRLFTPKRLNLHSLPHTFCPE